jgi:hypothetical protein
MAERVRVWVKEVLVEVYRGMQVKHALIAYDPAVYAACQRGELLVEDEHGFRVGLEGALHDGARFFVRTR